MTSVTDLRRLYLARTGRPFPGHDGVVAMIAQAYGGWRPAAEVVVAMREWTAGMGAASSVSA